MEINDVRELRTAIEEYQALEKTAPHSERRRELSAAISNYQRRFEGETYNPGQPFRNIRPPE